MKFPVSAVAAGTVLFVASALSAQESGTSHPEALGDDITVAPAAPTRARAVNTEVSAAAPSTPLATASPSQALKTRTAGPDLQPQAYVAAPVHSAAAVDPDAGIVTTRPYYANALAEGTLLKVRLGESLSTASTQSGTRFTALLAQNVEHDARVVFPAGSVVSGRITAVHGGRRMGAAASIHLEPELVTLPDGTAYRMSARLVDVNMSTSTRVNDEGTLVGTSNTKGTLAALSLTTGSAAVAGAMIGGPAGAAVGAGVGAGVGAIWWLKRDRQQTVAEGTELVLSLTRPLELTPLSR